MFARTRIFPTRLFALLIAISILPVLAACGLGDSTATPFPTTVLAQNVQILLTTNPDPPRAGPVNLIVEVKDAQGNVVEGAKVYLTANHTGMSHGGVAGDLVDLGNGRYEGEGSFSMSGTWRVEVKVAKEGVIPTSSTFDLAVR